MNWELGGNGAPGSRGRARSGSEVAGRGWDPRGRILVSSPAWLSPDCVASRGGVASLRTSAPTSESEPRHHGPGSSFCRSTGFRVWGGGAYGLVHCLVLGEEPGGRSIWAEKEPPSLCACPAAELGAPFFAGSPPRGQLGVMRVLAGGPGGQPLLLPPRRPFLQGAVCPHLTSHNLPAVGT